VFLEEAVDDAEDVGVGGLGSGGNSGSRGIIKVNNAFAMSVSFLELVLVPDERTWLFKRKQQERDMSRGKVERVERKEIGEIGDDVTRVKS
jgi:hypothetical protein